MGERVERWGIYEIVLQGPDYGNPYMDVSLSAKFKYKNREMIADGFYDGDGTYRIRFMPDTPGEWRWVTRSNVGELDGLADIFLCIEPKPGNHGPVEVQNRYHFAYADGTPYFQVGTTCYAWIHQGDSLAEQTLETLRHAPFNKLRMCVFPKSYAYNTNEPVYYPFEKNEEGRWDEEVFNPKFFRNLERRVGDLLNLGIEADIILFHPYDRWGFSSMTSASDDRYLRYVIARLAAFRNVWWSMANEWDIMPGKTTVDWDRFFKIVQECDPYQHLRSVHNCLVFYDHAKPWVTHVSVQNTNFNLNIEQVRDWRNTYGKPVVVDEMCYEGNIFERWGNITAQEMVRRFWEATINGGYAGHSETYLHPEDILWWSKGGDLYGESPERLAFYRRIMEQDAPEGLDPVDGVVENYFRCGAKGDDYYLTYFAGYQPAKVVLNLPVGKNFQVDIIDTWEMTTLPMRGLMTGRNLIDLPGKPYIAVRARSKV